MNLAAFFLEFYHGIHRVAEELFPKWYSSNQDVVKYIHQTTNGPANARMISWPSKAQNIQNLKIYGKEMTLTFNTHTPL